MKKILLPFLALFAAGSAFAQDRIITKEGDVLEAYRVDVGTTFIYYTSEDSDSADLKKIAREDVLLIKKKDGTKISLAVPTPQPSSATASQSSSAQSTAPLSQYTEEQLAEIADKNAKMIAEINKDVPNFPPDQASGKTARICRLIFGVKEESILYNGDVTIGQRIFEWDPDRGTEGKDRNEVFGLSFNTIVTNNTDKTIYLDLANSFIIRGCVSEPFYIPTSTTTTSVNSSSVGVNLGGIVPGLGTVVGGNTSATTSVVYSQRIVAVPPHSSKRLDTKSLSTLDRGDENWIGFRRGPGFMYDLYRYRVCWMDKEGIVPKVKYGEIYEFERNDQSPFLNFGTIISYSFDESCEHRSTVKALYYPKYLLGTGRCKAGAYKSNCIKYKPNPKVFSFYLLNDE